MFRQCRNYIIDKWLQLFIMISTVHVNVITLATIITMVTPITRIITDHNTYWGNNNFVVTLFTMIMKITTVTMITTEIWIILITSLAVITSYNDYIDNSYNKHLLSPHIQYSFQREQTVFFVRNWYKNESLFGVIR